MKKNQFILVGMILLLFVSCNTSVKVLSAWRSEDGHKMKERNILVIARTADSEVRADFETSIANKLRSKGYKATESFTRFPKMDPDKEMTEEREKFIIRLFRYEKINIVKYNNYVLVIITKSSLEPVSSKLYLEYLLLLMERLRIF